MEHISHTCLFLVQESHQPNISVASLFLSSLDNRIGHLVRILRMSQMAECALDDTPASAVAGCWYHCVCPRFGPEMVEILGEGLFHESFLHGAYLFMFLLFYSFRKREAMAELGEDSCMEQVPWQERKK